MIREPASFLKRRDWAIKQRRQRALDAINAIRLRHPEEAEVFERFVHASTSLHELGTLIEQLEKLSA